MHFNSSFSAVNRATKEDYAGPGSSRAYTACGGPGMTVRQGHGNSNFTVADKSSLPLSWVINDWKRSIAVNKMFIE